MPSKHLKVGHNQPDSETPFEWRFAGGLIVARYTARGWTAGVCVIEFLFTSACTIALRIYRKSLFSRTDQ